MDQSLPLQHPGFHAKVSAANRTLGTSDMTDYQIVDLFAGPGGLAEGFSGYTREDGTRPFEIAFSVEKEVSAHATLRLRAFLRQFGARFPDEYYGALNSGGDLPDFAALYPDQWAAAEAEALNLELGTDAARLILNRRLKELVARTGERTILIGGPPCQAYSLVGRARNKGNKDYRPEEDKRHFLYREYIDILRTLEPAAFVMENVKGLLSSSVDGSLVGHRILADLKSVSKRHGGYRLVALSGDADLFGQSESPALADFVIRAEDHGVPQARHRVIIVGVREDICRQPGVATLMKHAVRLDAEAPVEIGSVIGDMPTMRSGLSRGDDAKLWERAVLHAADVVVAAVARSDKAVARVAREARSELRKTAAELRRQSVAPSRVPNSCPQDLRDWLVDPRIKLLPNHETRGHMPADLARYLFAATFGQVHGRSPKADEFPAELAPDHANWNSGKFADRFRVQLSNRPGTTVTSHISKDGHYYIHPDPAQCRSLTVREAARIQTFPDNYLFLGNRTQQYVQVGNAVPPYLARKIASALDGVLQHAQFERRTFPKSQKPIALSA